MLVRFYLPDAATDFERVYEHCLDAIENRFGGCTVSTGIGVWEQPYTGKRFREPVHIIDVDCPSDGWIDDIQCWFDRLANYVRREGEQDSVLYITFFAAKGRMIGPKTIIQ